MSPSLVNKTMPVYGKELVDMGGEQLQRRTVYLYKGYFYINIGRTKVQINYQEGRGFFLGET